MNSRVIASLVFALAVAGAIFGARFLKDRATATAAARARMTQAPLTVSAVAAQQLTWTNTVNAVGSLASYRGITVKTELEGVVRRIDVTSGAVVRAGDLLVEFDTSVESAQLAGAEAQAKLADLNLARARDLRANGTNTPADLDAAEAALAQARSAVDQLRATIAKKRIVAPFEGRLGIVLVYPGQFLGKAESIVELQTLDPIHADFTVSQQEISRLAVGQRVNVRVDAHPGRIFKGAIEAVSPTVNEATRTMRVRATVANPGEALLPGMFGNVEIELPGTENAVALPSAAIVYNPYGDFVYVVEKGVAQQRFVRTGPQRGNLIAVLSGLKAGEEVVTSGQLKLRNGVPVQVDNTVAPSANPAPSPKDS